MVLLHHTHAASRRGDPRRGNSDQILPNIYCLPSHTFIASLPGIDPSKLFLKHFPEAGKSNQPQGLGKPCVDVQFWFIINMVAKLSIDPCFLSIFSKLVLKHRRAYKKMSHNFFDTLVQTVKAAVRCHCIIVETEWNKYQLLL